MATNDRLIDEDAARAIDSGRQTAGLALRVAQKHLQKVFIVFVIGLIGTIYALRLYIWPQLKEDLLAKGTGADVVATTPFDVILLQVKIGLLVGVIMVIPALIFYGRRPLKARGMYPKDGLAQPKFVGIGILAIILFIGGITYAYGLFFPIMFDFLAVNATNAGIAPKYSIVDWTEFILVLALSFGLAAELPLAMSGLAYSGIVPYETFRDKWKFAVVGIFAFGALFSPPDPFTQIMWAAPLLALYGLSLGLTKLVLKARRNDPEPKMGSPGDIDIGGLDADGVLAAPPEVFIDMTEEQALGHAQTAMQAEDTDKAQAILDRFDELAEADEGGEGEESTGDDSVDAASASTAADVASEATPASDEGATGNVVQSTTAGMFNAFTEDETTEDDIGGYYYDFAYILDSLTSKTFRIVGVFMAVLAGVFMFLNRGGLGSIRADFISRIPPEVRPEQATQWPRTLHPVEALVFEVKFSTVIAAVVVLPMVLYYAWPAMAEKKLVSGDRKVFYRWGIVLVVGLVIGSALGYMFIAPEIISYLVYDTIQAEMIVAYRVKTFFWLIFLTTAGIGLLADIPITMVMFQRAGIVTYRTLRERWRVVTIGAFVAGALLTPDTLYTMFIVAFPVTLMYFLGLGVLRVTTRNGTREAA